MAEQVPNFDVILKGYQDISLESPPLLFNGLDLWQIMYLPFCELFRNVQCWHDLKSRGTARLLIGSALGQVRQNRRYPKCLGDKARVALDDLGERDYILFETAYSAPSALRVLLPVINEMTDFVPLLCEYKRFSNTLMDKNITKLSYIDLLTKTDWEKTQAFLKDHAEVIQLYAKVVATKINMQKTLVDLWLRSNLAYIIMSIIAIKALLTRVEIKCCVSACEINIHGRIIALLCAQLNIPSILLQHASPDVPNELLIGTISEVVCVYSEIQRDIYVKAGVPPERLFITGAPAYGEFARAYAKRLGERHRLKKTLGLAQDAPTIIIGLNPVSITENNLTVETVYQTVKAVNQGIRLIVKLHPGENISSYKPMLRKYKDILFFSYERLPLLDALVVADLLITLQSNIGIDAIVVTVPVVEVNLFGRERKQAYSGYVPELTSQVELENFLRSFFSKKVFVDGLKARQGEYRASEFGKDVSASPRCVANLIRQIINDRKPQSMGHP
jgi:hypothetical protein